MTSNRYGIKAIPSQPGQPCQSIQRQHFRFLWTGTRAPTSFRQRWRRRVTVFVMVLLLAVVVGLIGFGLFLFQKPTTVLILGIDRRPGESRAVRTDTMLLIHADPVNSRMAWLSIPRDLWVTIPRRGEGRINAAHVFGELEEPGSGPARAAEVVSFNFDVPVQRTVRLDFDGFRQVIDAAGGIEVLVEKAVIDTAYPTDDYGITSIEIPAGLQQMNGETALQYARSRHGSSDFDRTARQQQVLDALAHKLSSPAGIMRLPQVTRAFRDAIATDLDVLDMVRLAFTWQRSGHDGLDRYIIDQTYTTAYRTDSGAAVLLPRWDLILPLTRRVFAP